MRHNLLFLLVLILVLGNQAHAQRYTFIEYSLKEGLPQSQVRSLFQDSQGFIWVGTLGGAARFDGRSFLGFDRTDGLLNNQINAIIELTDGTIVVGSSGSIATIKSNRVVSYAFEGDFKESAVNALYQEGERVWIGTENGICYFDGKSIKYPVDKGEPFRANIKAFYPSENELLILTKEKIYSYKNQGIQLYFEPNDRSVNFFDIERMSDGNFLLATKGMGLAVLESTKTLRTMLEDEALKDVTITGITKDKKGRYWCSSRFGFYVVDQNKLHHFDERNGLKTPDIRDILSDNEGNIWLATYGSGMQKFTGQAFYAYTTDEGLSSDAIMSITQDTDGTFWFSTFDKGVCHLEGASVEQMMFDDQGGNNRMWTSVTDNKGLVWFGSSFGLFAMQNGKLKSYAEHDSLLDPMVISLNEDSKGRLWIGTAKGVNFMQEGVLRTMTNVAGSPQSRVRDIQEDKDGNVWFATRTGLFRYDGVSFTAFDERDGLPDKTIYSLEVDERNRLWIGTQNGIAIWNGVGFTTHTIEGGGAANSINFLKLHRGEMWFGTNNGLYSVSTVDAIRGGDLQLRRYGLQDGLRSLETNLNAVFVDRDGILWFGTTEGAMALNTELLKEKDHRTFPKVAITNIQLGFLNPDWSRWKLTTNPISGLPENAVVDYKSNHWSFEFTGLTMSYPDDVQYQFMLEGFDEDWQALTKSTYVTYSNLPFSTFTFKVRAVSRFGILGEPAVFSFTINPPFWLTWWFIVLEVLAVAGFVWLLLFIRKRILQSRHEKETLEMRSRMLSLEQQSLNSSMNRHFIFNALNSIQYYINRQDRLAANKYLSDFARLIRKNLDSSQENITPLRDEMERLELYLKLEHMRFKDKFDYEIKIDPSIPLDLVKVPAMLLQPFLENSIWHGLLPKDSPGRVLVELVREDQALRMIITDNGIGIDNSLKSKTDTDSHISKGMEITQSRIELLRKMRGENVRLIGPEQINGPGGTVEGTRVEIIIPVNFAELF
jgi:ligand-binding sensor domain-containing protein